MSADTYWQGYVSPINPFVQSGWIGTCQFPQITSGGLDDSWQHGQDLYAVYHDLLDFLPGREGNWRSKVVYRVTQNVITSQVAGMVISGMWGTTESVPLVVEVSPVPLGFLDPKGGFSARSPTTNSPLGQRCRLPRAALQLPRRRQPLLDHQVILEPRLGRAPDRRRAPLRRPGHHLRCTPL